MRYARLALAAVMLASTASVAAAEIDLDVLCDDKAGPGTDTINPTTLLTKAFGSSFPVELFMRDDGSITRGELFQALVYSQFCEGDAPLRACSAEEAESVQKARLFIRGLEGHPKVTITPVAAPSGHEWLLPGLQPEPYWTMLDERRRYVLMTCRRRTSDAGGNGNDKESGMAFLLTKNVDDLTLPRADHDELEGVPLAEITYVDDNAGKTETVQIHGTAGIRFKLRPGGYLIPYVQIVRSHVEDSTGVEPATDTSKLAVGLLTQWQVARYDRIDLTGLYAHDLEDGHEVIEARFGWRPGFLYGLPSFRGDWRFLCKADERERGRCRRDKSYLGIRTDLKLLATAGHVINVGDNPELIANRDYLRAGAEGRITLFGSRGFVDDMSVDVGYRHLFGISGAPDHISGLTAGVNYWIAGSPHVSLRLGYERSRDEQTLERTNEWTVALGARF